GGGAENRHLHVRLVALAELLGIRPRLDVDGAADGGAATPEGIGDAIVIAIGGVERRLRLLGILVSYLHDIVRAGAVPELQTGSRIEHKTLPVVEAHQL